MPNYSKKVVYLSDAQRQELFTNNTVTVNGTTITYNDNDIYVTPQTAPITDVKINNVSIGSNGVANIPIANANILGTVKINPNFGIGIYNGELLINDASESDIKSGTNSTKAVSSYRQHQSVFYGLAKLAGADMASSSNPVGQYTDDAKQAIQNMLGITDLLSTEESSTATAAHTVGSVFLMNGKLYKTTNDITIGDAVASGTNCTPVNISEVYATIDNPIFTNSISLGRKANTTVGANSVAIGSNVEASGQASFAIGNSSVASAPNSKAEGYSAIASGSNSHAEGNGTIANGSNVHAEGKFNTEQTIIEDWVANTHYNVGDKVYHVPTTYECIEENTDASWTSGHWKQYGFTSEVALVVGNGIGSSSNQRSNALTLNWNGDLHLDGEVYINANANGTGGIRLPHDIQINGTSIVSNGVANIPIATSSVCGVVKVSQGFGIGLINNTLYIKNANAGEVKAGTNTTNPITPNIIGNAVFYGLAKAAGADEKNSSNAVGVYTEPAKTAIRNMIGVETGTTLVETISGTTPTLTCQPNVRYNCGEVSTISITPPSSGTCDVFFTSGSTATVLTVPNTVKFPVWFDSTSLEKETIYEIMITDGVYGSVMTWAIS